jgi:hypothetical protein
MLNKSVCLIFLCFAHCSIHSAWNCACHIVEAAYTFIKLIKAISTVMDGVEEVFEGREM